MGWESNGKQAWAPSSPNLRLVGGEGKRLGAQGTSAPGESTPLQRGSDSILG